ncbi:unnamed protein product, partial [Musa acuminata subsp. burmannicoides]
FFSFSSPPILLCSSSPRLYGDDESKRRGRVAKVAALLGLNRRRQGRPAPEKM